MEKTLSNIINSLKSCNKDEYEVNFEELINGFTTNVTEYEMLCSYCKCNLTDIFGNREYVILDHPDIEADLFCSPYCIDKYIKDNFK